MKITVQKLGALAFVEAKSKNASVTGKREGDLSVIEAKGIGNVRQLKSAVRSVMRELK